MAVVVCNLAQSCLSGPLSSSVIPRMRRSQPHSPPCSHWLTSSRPADVPLRGCPSTRQAIAECRAFAQVRECHVGVHAPPQGRFQLAEEQGRDEVRGYGATQAHPGGSKCGFPRSRESASASAPAREHAAASASLGCNLKPHCDETNPEEREAVQRGFSRRSVAQSALALVLAHALPLSFSGAAAAAEDESSGFMKRALSRYIKKKKLGPLEVYVPGVVLTAAQLEEVQRVINDSSASLVELNAARNFLRSGPAATFRTDVRAVAQYAAESQAAGVFEPETPVLSRTPVKDAESCLQALVRLDTLMRAAVLEEDIEGKREAMKETVRGALDLLDGLLLTLPESVLQRSSDLAVASEVSP